MQPPRPILDFINNSHRAQLRVRRLVVLMACSLSFAPPTIAEEWVPTPVESQESAEYANEGGVQQARFIDSGIFAPSAGNGPADVHFVSVGLGGVPRGDDVSIAFGFDFLQPSWSDQSFSNLLPGMTAASFPGLSLNAAVDHDYGLAPRIEAGVGIGDSQYGLSVATGFLSLSGQQRQNVGTGASNETLNADNNINILTVNAPQVSYLTTLGDVGLFDVLDEAIVEIKIGTRYSSLNQNFSANLRRGTGQAVTTSSI